MEFEWDENKRRSNLKKHGVDFEDIPNAFASRVLEALDTRKDYGEDRWVCFGIIHSIVVVIVFTERREDLIRIISARRAEQYEKEEYYAQIRNRL